MLSEAPKTLLTSEEYLAIERKAEYKSEYFAGEMFAMAGASKRHNLIVSNMIRILGTQLLDRDCNVYNSDMRVKIEKFDKYTYPDVVVAGEEERFEDDQEDTLLNPLVIVEVLSGSTEAYDRGKKFEYYQSIPSFVEYLLVSQTTYRVEQYIRQDGRKWTYSAFYSEDDTIQISAIECHLVLKDVYAKVQIQPFKKMPNFDS
jgi:Uma2 family endonuclease